MQQNKYNSEVQLRYYYKNRDEILRKKKHADRLRMYGCTEEDYQRLLAKCGGCCTICKTVPDRGLDVDHCHVTGKVRGLLCNNCNKDLGLFRDNLNLLKKAAEYLDEASSIRYRDGPETFDHLASSNS